MVAPPTIDSRYNPEVSTEVKSIQTQKEMHLILYVMYTVYEVESCVDYTHIRFELMHGISGRKHPASPTTILRSYRIFMGYLMSVSRKISHGSSFGKKDQHHSKSLRQKNHTNS